MSNAVSQQTHDLDDHEWDHILHQMEQYWPIREKVSTALKEATAAFAAQFTKPDAYKYIEACARFAEFLDLKIPMDDSEQKSVLQILQFACAMHENAVSNPTLTATERSSHQLASTFLASLCKSAIESGLTNVELWCEAFNLSHRAHQAFSRAAHSLNLCKYLDKTNLPDDCFFNAESSASKTDTASSPTSFSPGLFTPKSESSAHDLNDSPLSTKAKAKALATLKERPKGAPLGRAHTMPPLTRIATSPHSSRTTRGSSKAHSRRAPGLSTLPEE